MCDANARAESIVSERVHVRGRGERPRPESSARALLSVHPPNTARDTKAKKGAPLDG
jgi:hypothetical protein